MLIRTPAIAGVIAVAIGTVVICILIMGMLIMYSDERDRIAQQRETSTEIQGDRIREDVGATLELTGDNNVTNEWGEATQVTGPMVRCDDGRVITADEDVSIPTTGSVIEASAGMGDDMRDLLARCAAPWQALSRADRRAVAWAVCVL